MPVEVLTQIVATISDPSAMLGPEVNKTYSETSHFIVRVLRYRIRKGIQLNHIFVYEFQCFC